MEIRYQRTYAPARGKRYTAGEIQGLLGYAMEIADPRVPMKEGRLAPGEVCLMLFGITPEEYALKDTQPKQLDALAERLAKELPADRLLGWRVLDLKGAQLQRNVQPRTGESIDGGEFACRVRERAASAHAGPVDALLLEARRLQKLCAEKDAPEGQKQDWVQARRALGSALMELDVLYAADDALLNGRWSAIGFDGRVEIFTTRERYERVAAQIVKAHAGIEIWKLREIHAAEIPAFLRRLGEDGLHLLRVDNGFAAAELQLDDLQPIEACENAALRSAVIREVEYGVRYQKQKEAQAEEPRLRGALESTLTLRGIAWREIGNAKLYAVCSGGRRENCAVVGDKSNGVRMLAAFTTSIRAAAFAEQLPGDTMPVEMNFDELAQRSRMCWGLMIDPGALAYRLPCTEYDKVKEMRARPPVLVRIQPPAAPQKPAVQAGASLPDPDQFDLPAKPQPEETQPVQEAPEAEARPRKKGFFRNLLKK